MRAREFVTEAGEYKGKIHKRQHASTRGLNIFTDSNFDRTYLLNRIMMAAACSDGKNPIKMSPESWSAKFNTAHPYSELEQEMLRHAYKLVGAKHKDLNDGDLRSMELDLVNKKSPVKPFKGYKKK